MAVKIVQTILKQETTVGSLEKVDMLFDFIAPLVQDVEGVEEDDDEVSGAICPKYRLPGVHNQCKQAAYITHCKLNVMPLILEGINQTP